MRNSRTVKIIAARTIWSFFRSRRMQRESSRRLQIRVAVINGASFLSSSDSAGESSSSGGSSTAPLRARAADFWAISMRRSSMLFSLEESVPSSESDDSSTLWRGCGGIGGKVVGKPRASSLASLATTRACSDNGSIAAEVTPRWYANWLSILRPGYHLWLWLEETGKQCLTCITHTHEYTLQASLRSLSAGCLRGVTYLK